MAYGYMKVIGHVHHVNDKNNDTHNQTINSLLFLIEFSMIVYTITNSLKPILLFYL